MHACYLSISLAGVLMLANVSAWAQVDTSEGGGTSNERLQMLDDLLGRVRALEDQQVRRARSDANAIKDEIREVEWIEGNRRKLLELQARIQKLEGRVDAIVGNDAQASQTPSNQSSSGKAPAQGGKPDDVKQSGGKRAPAPATRPPQATAAATGEPWRFRQYHGRWWYWLPSGEWTYWTGKGWAPSVVSNAAP
jgi:hypothetical protein